MANEESSQSVMPNVNFARVPVPTRTPIGSHPTHPDYVPRYNTPDTIRRQDGYLPVQGGIRQPVDEVLVRPDMARIGRSILYLFHRVLTGGGVTLRRGVVPCEERANVEFDSRMVTISDDCSRRVSNVALIHELVHLDRGPCYVGDEAHEEQLVQEITARILVPRECLPGILETVDLARVADELDVPIEVVRLGVALAIRDRIAGIGGDEVA